MTRRILALVLALVGLAFVGIQLVPYRVHNPPVRAEPAWDTPQTRALAKRACFDCHSNEVEVPWYGHIAPVAWVVRDHVDEGRSQLNFSEWDRPQEEAHDAAEEIEEGEMPPTYYLALHGEARLTDAEWRLLAAGLSRTLGGTVSAARGDHEDHDDDDD